ncbi:hypothetical protein [Dehalobacterium formicoaceticum]|uniref:Uncharacterized protein n=1 Tax=Dehalobacterium formicoaceticum TaxID=51515 RepID=A0ABT1Y8C6_9FIRM|nr:hypothetical protein [Dehalobacterium formicoaceticum]MCR6546736.1 hypothetical protein [Dehalobacterium formicoaceticum]
MNEDYVKEFEKIKQKHLKNREKLFEKYKDYIIPPGLDGEPYNKELKEEMNRFQNEWNKLKEKYNKLEQGTVTCLRRVQRDDPFVLAILMVTMNLSPCCVVKKTRKNKGFSIIM